ncbi:MAG: hypothetical protein LC800_19155 [Acidobacteria bacterium]|nr:hypothetical protein [Acidobacteriota bacterium]
MLGVASGLIVEQPDTRQFWKRELSTLAQYFVIASVAGVGAFVCEIVWTTSPLIQGGHASTVNFGEAWRLYKPAFYGWLAAFSALALLRLLVLFVMKRLTGYR